MNIIIRKAVNLLNYLSVISTARVVAGLNMAPVISNAMIKKMK